MSKPTISDVENAFQPAKEVNDAQRFAGRTNAVEQAFYALLTEGANIAIVGNRGVGKTSLARQVQNFGTGNNEILDKIGAAKDHNFDFLVAYHACGDSTRNIDDMLSGILTREAGLGAWLYYLPKTSKMMSSLSPALAAKLLGAGFEIRATSNHEHVMERVSVPSTVQGVFENVVQDIVSSGMTSDGILIIVDEFDQIQDPTGFAPFLKALATNSPGVRFCIVGVAKDIQDLMKEHASSDRLFAGSIVTLDPMPREELMEIISIAEESIDRSIVFADDAKEKIIEIAAGHPYLVHLLGKFSFREAFRRECSEITSEDVGNVLSLIAENRSDPVLEGRYRKAVVSSRQREIVLKALAAHQDDRGEVLTTDAYRTALEQGVDNASQYVGQLVTNEYGAEVEKIRERYYRFKDSLFAACVAARPLMRGTVDD